MEYFIGVIWGVLTAASVILCAGGEYRSLRQKIPGRWRYLPTSDLAFIAVFLFIAFVIGAVFSPIIGVYAIIRFVRGR